MRTLNTEELTQVYGGTGDSCCKCDCKPDDCKPDHDDHKKNEKHHGNNGYGNGGCDGVPGHSGKEDCDR